MRLGVQGCARTIGHGFAVVAILCALADQPSVAQEAVESETLQDRQKAAEERRQVAAEAVRSLGSEDLGEEVTYQDILKDPDNVELNVRYAKQQLARGNYKNAAGTLERILMVRPDINEVRLYYAIVLFQLDNPDEAEAQFNLIKDLPMAPEMRAQIGTYLEEIENRRQTTRYVVNLSFGGRYDTNRNSASKWNHNLVLDSHSALEDDDRIENDWGVLGSTSVSMNHDMGFQDRHELLASASYYHNHQFNRDDLITQVGAVSGGVKLNFPEVTVTPTIFYNQVRLSHERYTKNWGAQLRLDKKLARPLNGFASAKYTDETYYHPTDSTSSHLYTGYAKEYVLGLDYIVSPAHKVTASWTHTDKRAKVYYYEYDGDEGSLNHSWLLGGGQFLISSLAARWRVYKGEYAAVSDRTRRDKRFKGNITYGVPVDTLLDLAFDDRASWPEPIRNALGGWTWTNSVEYLWQQSNILNYDYDNQQYQTLLSRRWEF